MKKNMNLTVLIILILNFFLMDTSVAETIKVSFPPAKPGAFLGDDGKPTGPVVDYFLLITDKMGISAKFKVAPVKRVFLDLENGNTDAVLFASRSSEYEGKFVYPQQPFARVRLALAVRNNFRHGKITGVEDLAGITIGTWAGAYLPEMLKNKRLRIDPMHGKNIAQRSLNKLIEHRIDAYLGYDIYALKFWVKTGGFEGKVKILTLPEPPVSFYTLFSKAGADVYLMRYEKALSEVQKEKSFEKVFVKFIENYTNNLGKSIEKSID